MFPGLGFTEILVLGILALLVLGPKDLPLMLRKLGRWMAQLRGMAQEFRTGFDELARQAELDELRREVEALRNVTTRGMSGFVDELSRPVDMTPISPAPRPLPAPAPTPIDPIPEDPPHLAAEPQLPFEIEAKPSEGPAVAAGGGRAP
jgi:sec-independent protein translocase protein TatB